MAKTSSRAGARAAASVSRTTTDSAAQSVAERNCPADSLPEQAGAIDAASFEQSLAELEALVDRLEQGELGLEESLATFERGVRLTRGCQKALDSAEQRVRILIEASADADAAPFSPASGPKTEGPSRTHSD